VQFKLDENLPGSLVAMFEAAASVDTSNPAIDRHFKTGH